jgi:hypothetical protein
VSEGRGSVVAHILGQHEGRREAEEIAHDHEGAVEVAARQPGQARTADQQGDAEGNPDLQAPGAGVALNDAYRVFHDVLLVVVSGDGRIMGRARHSVQAEETMCHLFRLVVSFERYFFRELRGS